MKNVLMKTNMNRTSIKQEHTQIAVPRIRTNVKVKSINSKNDSTICNKNEKCTHENQYSCKSI